MSARQTKKQRKGRSNANNRERTVTTLTGDPDTPYLVPPSTEEASVAVQLVPPPFSGTPTTIQGTTMGPQPYPMSGSYHGFGFNGSNFGANMHQQQSPHLPFTPSTMSMTAQQVQAQKPPLPPGKNDLEILQNLKRIILENQHPFFRAVPQPEALAALYKGPLTAASESASGNKDAEKIDSTASVETAAVPQTVSASSDTPMDIPTRGEDAELPKGDQPSQSLPAAEHGRSPIVCQSFLLQDSLMTVSKVSPQVDATESSSGNNVASSVIAPPSTADSLDLAPSNRSKTPSAGPPVAENQSPEKYDPRSPALWDRVKTEPLDDLMKSPSPLHKADSWKSNRSYPENGSLDTKAGHPVDARPYDGDDPGPYDENDGPRDWQDRNRRQSYDLQHQGPRRQSDVYSYDGPIARRGQEDGSGPHRESGDARQANGASFGRVDVPNDSRPSDDLRSHPIGRVPLISRIETDEAVAANNSASGIAPHFDTQDRLNNPRQTGDANALPPVDQGPNQRGFQPHRKRFFRHQPGGPPNQNQPYASGGGQHYEPRPAFQRPQSPHGLPAGNAFQHRSASVEGRGGARVPPSPSRGGREFRGPPRSISRDRSSNTYRPEYDAHAPRYGDNRLPYNREFSPPPADRGRVGVYAPPHPPPPSSGSGRDWNYPANNPRREWNGPDDDSYKHRGNWDAAPAGDNRERYDREIPPPGGWESRPERDYPTRGLSLFAL